MEIGKVYEIAGENVLIESGCYLDPVYGRVSNYWYGRAVNEGGSLGEEWRGYGQRFKEVPSQIETKVHLS